MNSVYDRFRDPAYTGERRCWPCTLVNGIILVFACALLAVASVPLAGALAVGGVAAIAFRGYLVPYTPEFAPRLVSALPWDPFHTDGGRIGGDDAPASSGTLAGEDEGSAGERVVAGLLDSGVLVADGEQLFLDDGFRTAWDAEIRELRAADDDALAAALPEASSAIEEAKIYDDRRDRRWFIASDGTGNPAGETWLSRPIAIAEVAAVRALAEHAPETDDALRTRAARPLRTFLRECPVCGGPIEETTRGDCCGAGSDPTTSPQDDVLACADCGERVFTFEK